MKDNFEAKELRSYKGYGIDKCYWINFFGKKIGLPFYLVSKDDEYIGEEYKTLNEAKAFIDSI